MDSIIQTTYDGKPIIVYGMIGITTLVLAFVTLKDSVSADSDTASTKSVGSVSSMIPAMPNVFGSSTDDDSKEKPKEEREPEREPEQDETAPEEKEEKNPTLGGSKRKKKQGKLKRKSKRKHHKN
jgi:hypothetical protein